MPRPVIVLKFGGSVLRGEHDLLRAVAEVESWVHKGWNVFAIVSAFEGTTDTLIRRARQYGEEPLPEAQALLTATGELTSASLLGLALHRAGLRSTVAAPWTIGLRATGEPLDAFPQSINAAAVRVLFEEHRAVVVPGFIALDEIKRLVLLGRGGSDLSAIYIAEQVGAAKCRLVKDVDGLYEWDPARWDKSLGRHSEGAEDPSELDVASLGGPSSGGARAPRRFASLSWNDALALDEGIVQHKAIRFARDRRLKFEVGCYGSTCPTIVGDVALEFAASASVVAGAS